MQHLRHRRGDGRALHLYAFDRPLPTITDVSKADTLDREQLELRWNALLGEWVVISTGRQERTFLPPDESCPLCPTASPDAFPTEIPAADFEIAVFDNRFPSFLTDGADALDVAPAPPPATPLDRTAPAVGACEVVVYTPEHAGSLRTMTHRQVRNLIDVWEHRYAELSARAEVRCVFIFENRGPEIGVTLTHPHGQIYAFPYIPPRIAAEHAAADRHGEACLVCDLVASEVADGTRLIAKSRGFVAYVPFAARVPYEVHVTATGHRATLLDLPPAERDGLAAILREVQARYDGLWDRDMPCTMSMHQAPAVGAERPGDHLHIDFMPPYRSRDKLKYLAGVETGAGSFINDTSPEEKAAELRAVDPQKTKSTQKG